METTVFWSCTGLDASDVSLGAAKSFAEEGTTLIVELPCLGIPRLGFASGVLDRERNTEEAIGRFEQGKPLDWAMLHQISKRCFILPASVFAAPDYPVAARVSVDTLMRFIPALQEMAHNGACDRLILDCQGQLNSPMSFFSLKAADQAVIPLGKPADAAYALASVRRLVQVYQQRADKFFLAAAGNIRVIEGAVSAGSRDDEALKGIRVINWDCRKIKSALAGKGAVREKGAVLPTFDIRRRQIGISAEKFLERAALGKGADSRIDPLETESWPADGTRDGLSVYL